MKVSVRASSLVSPDCSSKRNGSRMLLPGYSQLIWFVPYRTRFLFYEPPASESFTFDRVVAELKSALGKALVEFYPLAGRLNVREDGLLELDCGDQGVLFIEALADVPLEELQRYEEDGDFALPREVCSDLEQTGGHVLQLPLSSDAPLFIIQVTGFLDGGICISIKFNHQLLDGTGTWHFVQAWAELCRGESISLKPVVEYPLESIEEEQKQQLELPNGFKRCRKEELISIMKSDPTKFAMKCFVFKKEMLLKLKQKYPGFTKFQLLTGHIWRNVTSARLLGENEETGLLFPVNLRGRVKPMQTGYYGMAALMLRTRNTSAKQLLVDEIHGASLVRQRIQEFSEAQAEAIAKWGMCSAGDKDNPTVLNVNHTTDLNLGSSFYFPVYHDFGFGKPIGMTIAPATSDGKIFYFPGRAEGSIAAYISLTIAAIERLQTDPTFLTG